MRNAGLLLLLLATPLFAAEPPARFCEGTYALCIKAPCEPIVTREKDGTYKITQANCVCDVEAGWSMGPDTCAQRKPVKKGGRTYLVSTYSNLFNETNRTLTCDSPDTVWAWCYGAPCAVDEKDTSKAICTCPVKQSKAGTLGGGCDPKSCISIWSAATPKNVQFANQHFYKYMTEHGLPANPPAKDCPSK